MEGREARLEPLDPSHVAELLAIADPELSRVPSPASDGWSVAKFESAVGGVLFAPGTVPFAVRHVPTGLIVGRAAYTEIRTRHRGVEIGAAWIARAFHTTAVNPEIRYLMLRHAFETVRPTALRVQFTTDESNERGQRAFEKLGAVREGVLRQHRIVPGGSDPGAPEQVRNTVVYSVVAGEWERVKAGLEARLGWGRRSVQ
jgi:ribosomal-protein-alanine N-acetyltransferase